jgi:hypothetical protein
MQMKKILFIFLLSSTLLACKKAYNCRCASTIYLNGKQDAYYGSITKAMSEKMTEKQAKSACESEAANIDVTYKNIFTNNGNVSSRGYTSLTNCNLE